MADKICPFMSGVASGEDDDGLDGIAFQSVLCEPSCELWIKKGRPSIGRCVFVWIAKGRDNA